MRHEHLPVGLENREGREPARSGLRRCSGAPPTGQGLSGVAPRTLRHRLRDTATDTGPVGHHAPLVEGLAGLEAPRDPALKVLSRQHALRNLQGRLPGVPLQAGAQLERPLVAPEAVHVARVVAEIALLLLLAPFLHARAHHLHAHARARRAASGILNAVHEGEALSLLRQRDPEVPPFEPTPALPPRGAPGEAAPSATKETKGRGTPLARPGPP